MVATIETVSFQGIDVCPVEVQVHIGNGLPSFTIVGLANKAVSEARERVRASLFAIGLALPPKRITINLAPADTMKEGSHFDLAIALGLLVAMNVLPQEELQNYVALGELSLDGRIAKVGGVLPAAIHASSLDLGLICPKAQGAEAAWAGGIDILAPQSLLEIVNHFKGTQILSPPSLPRIDETIDDKPQIDLTDIKGQETAKRALEIAAAGGHSMLMSGPPGSGKSLLAARLATILPKLSPAEALELSQIHSLGGTLPAGGLISTRPFRSPHHSASVAAIVGGGTRAKPGEVSLAHRGVLFLDELPEFNRSALEALRQPIETGTVSIARANAHVTYPARFQLIAAMNPCRCGHIDDDAQACTRAPLCAAEYQNRISGPLLDRFDLFVDVAAVSVDDLAMPSNGESSTTVLTRVEAAREFGAMRMDGYANGVITNAEIDGRLLEEITNMDSGARALLLEAAKTLGLSARAYHRVQRVARTIADLERKPNVSRTHIGEALSYRRVNSNRAAIGGGAVKGAA